MIATQQYVKQSFDKYNSLIFNGELPTVEIRLSRGERFLGKMEYRRIYGPFGRLRRCEDFVMRITSVKDLEPDALDDVIIHEMIHYFIAWKGIRDTSAHGKVFRQMMAEINSRFKRHITISVKNSNGACSNCKPHRERIICISKLQDGQLGVTVCSKTRVQQIKRLLPRYYHILGMSWYASSEQYFSRFPRSNTPKIYKADQAELLKALESEVSNSMLFDCTDKIVSKTAHAESEKILAKPLLTKNG